MYIAYIPGVPPLSLGSVMYIHTYNNIPLCTACHNLLYNHGISLKTEPRSISDLTIRT
jgi:hypothetical protein